MSCELGHYILEGHTPVAVPDEEIEDWMRWVKTHTSDCIVATNLELGAAVEVVTWFLAIDVNVSQFLHAGASTAPLVFETSIYIRSPIGVHRGSCLLRYPTWEAAERGHAVIMRRVRMTMGN